MAELRMTIAGNSPGTPPTNQVSLFASAVDKRLYVKDDTGTEVKVMTDEAVLDGLTATAPVLVSAGSTPNISVAPVTTTTNGLMIFADKVKLDNSTASPTPNELVIRDGLGNSQFNEVTASVFNGVATSVQTVPQLIGDVTTNGTTNATSISNGVISDINIANGAGIAITKLDTNPLDRSIHTGTQTASTISDFGTEIDAHLTLTAPIVNDMIDASAGILLSKLAVDPLDRTNHTGTQLISTISDYSAQVNLDIASYISSNPITNAEIDASAAIDLSKLAVDPLDRTNHTGTQLASTISDFTVTAQSAIVSGDGIDVTAGTVTALGTADRIDVGVGGIDIASTYLGQSTITTLGIVTTGTWQADTIGLNEGGTGQNSRGEARNNLLSVQEVNSSVTLDTTYNVILADGTASIITLTLPAATTRAQYTFKKIDAINNVLINPNPGDTIDGVAGSLTLALQYEYVTLVSDLVTGWYIVAQG